MNFLASQITMNHLIDDSDGYKMHFKFEMCTGTVRKEG